MLVTAGLAVFGVATYQLYARSQYDRLDDQLRASAGAVVEPAGPRRRGLSARRARPRVRRRLAGGRRPGRQGAAADGRPSLPAAVVPLGHLRRAARRRRRRGRQHRPVEHRAPCPTCDDAVDRTGPAAGSSAPARPSGSGRWRVYAGPADRLAGNTVVVAVPLDRGDARRCAGWSSSKARPASPCSSLLAAGAWLILRRGLRPLEQMATSARSITAGDLSQRVTPADGRTEVGQLGLALNTMLGEIEAAFAERDATEHRLRQFLADASHELRTPLTSIQGFAELFRLGERAGARRGRPAGHPAPHRGGVGPHEDAGRGPAAPGPARPDPTGRAGARSTSPCWPPTPAATRWPPLPTGRSPSTPRSRSWSSATSDHLRQAIANLVTNALRHTPGRHADRGERPRRRNGRGDRGRARPRAGPRRRGPGPRLRPLLAGRPGPGRARAPASAWPSWPASPPSTAAKRRRRQRRGWRRGLHPALTARAYSFTSNRHERRAFLTSPLHRFGPRADGPEGSESRCRRRRAEPCRSPVA